MQRKGGFSNPDQTSFMSIALQSLNTVFCALPKAPQEKDIKQAPDESAEDYHKRKTAASEILRFFDKINAGQNCSRSEMQKMRQLLHNYCPSVINSQPVGGDSDFTFRILCSIFAPNFDLFAQSKNSKTEVPTLAHWTKDGIALKDANDLIGTFLGADKNNQMDASTSSYRFEKGIALPPFVFFNVRRLNPENKDEKALPKTIELCDAVQGKKATYELSAISLSGADHAYYSLENGQWIQYESEHISALNALKTQEILNGEHIESVFYRRIG